MQTQELHEEFLLNLCDRLYFEIDIRSMVHGGREDPWQQPMYLIPIWNLVEKVKSFKRFFDELDVEFPTEEVYRHPIDLSTAFSEDLIRMKEEDFVYKGEHIKVAYKYII